jgi:NTE family protein
MKKYKVGLALSSGGARGGVHLGVIKILQKANIPIQAVSGSSAGAIVAACYACGTLGKLEGVLKMTKKKHFLHFLDPHFSKESLFKGKKAIEFLSWLTDNKKFNQTRLDLYIMSSNIVNGKEVVFTSGRIAPALLASISIPPLFKPVKKGKALLVDGGLLHGIPVEILKKNGCQYVIASTIKERKRLSLERNGNLIKTYHQLKRLKIGLHQNANIKQRYSFLKSVTECMNLGITDSADEKKMADLIIETDVDGIQTYDFDKASECITRGEKQGQKQLKQLKKDLIRLNLS